MKTYVKEITVPYVKQKREQLNHLALAIFKGQLTEEVLQIAPGKESRSDENKNNLEKGRCLCDARIQLANLMRKHYQNGLDSTSSLDPDYQHQCMGSTGSMHPISTAFPALWIYTTAPLPTPSDHNHFAYMYSSQPSWSHSFILDVQCQVWGQTVVCLPLLLLQPFVVAVMQIRFSRREE